MSEVMPAHQRSEAVVITYLAFLGMLMATAIDISLPALGEIDADLGAGDREALVITLFFIGAAVGQLITGPVSDLIGRRPVLFVALILYVGAGVAAALAPSYGFLLVTRFVWGIAAAAPTGLRTAMARDLYSGDVMARVTTVMMAVFLLGPVFTPLIGEGLLTFADWPIVYWFTAALGVAALGASLWFGETLPPERRQPIELATFRRAAVAIARTRVTIGMMIANVFWSAAFFIFLSSAQPVFDRVYDRESQIAYYFAFLGLCTIPLLLANNRRIDRVGARRAARASGLVSVTACVVGTVIVLVVDAPGFWVWYVWLVFASSFITLTSPPIVALALEPMGDLAGTVSSLLFFTGFAIGSVLAEIVNAQISTTVTPFVIGFSIYACIGFTAQLFASGGRTVGAEPAATGSPG